MVVLFRTASNRVTLAFVYRRPNRRDPERDVLGNVALIREINTADPHRAHLDILAELSLDTRLKWMDDHGKAHNFDGLLDAWLDALDTEELNRRFYRDLFQWFQRAVDVARFPAPATKTVSAEEHVIRLITRLLFVWFLREKGLVADELFIENRVDQLLKDYDAANGDSYYRAVLQNLFFATLNTEIGERRFSSQTRDDHRNFSRYRYRNEMAEPDGLLELFAQTPFINGGLFDCLDSFDSIGAGGVRIDRFTDNARHREGYSIPNRLFFGDDGLITRFNRYKFTVEENTPAEREVALDPELLGKVFENLLAAFNPETRENARKQTGSYYTPRAVVDYMVDEALVATLAQKAAPPDGDADFWQERLRHLLDYDVADADSLFTTAEREAVVRAIAGIKVLDPAVGSGAFPMGVLHKLTLALRRLDPANQLWEELQKELAGQRAASAFGTADQAERDDELREISATFERYRDSDFGRKLYLIQNGIYGVDLQPIATQIARLRFFISLAIEQEPTDDAGGNYGIKPLPNLETRFVAADTLLGLARPAQLALGQTDAVKELQDALNRNRERHFHANTRQRKQAYCREDARLRKELSRALREANFSAGDADKIAAWDPYDQNARADWFDAEYIFGVADGFDVVIGNPPYVQLQRDGGKLGRVYRDTGYEVFARTGDIYYLFYERGVNLLKDGGHLCYVSSNQWMRVDSGKALRRFIESNNPVRLVNLGAGVFDSVTVNTCVLIVNCSANRNELQAADVRQAIQQFPPAEWTHIRPARGETWTVMPAIEQRIKEKMDTEGTPLKSWGISIKYGIKTGYDKAFVIANADKEALVASDPKSAEIIKPVLRGRDIQRYRAKSTGLWLIDTHNEYGNTPAISIGDYPAIKGHLDKSYTQLEKRQDKGKTPYNLRNCAYYKEFAKGKIAWGNLNNQAKFAYVPERTFINTPTTMLTPYSPYLLAVLNSTLLDWYFRQIGVERDGGYYEYKPMFIERLPIPKISAAKQCPFVRLVDKIIEAKSADPDADTTELEVEIDWLVYELYGLTNEETAVVADFFWDGTLSEEEEDQALLRAMKEGDIDDRVSLEEVLQTLRLPDGC